MRRLTVSRPQYEREHSVSLQCPLRGRTSRRNDLASFIEYLRFCRWHPAYHACIANQIRVFDWIDERRIEMRAEGRPHWVPNDRDFEHAMWDCWDDLVKGI
jgi:hypothetical protein